jgi:hypothetical protein
MKYLNKENVTAVVVVVIGVILASMVAPTIQGIVGKLRKKTVA